MLIRDLIVSVSVFSLLPICVIQPWLGIVAWSWLGYMNPHKLTWGYARTMPFAEMIALATFVGILATRDSEKRPIPWYRETYLLALLWVVFTLTTFTAMYPDEAWKKWEDISKILLFVFFTLKFFQTRNRLRLLLLVIALSLGFYGLKGGIWSLFIDFGVNRVEGPEETFIGGNTEIGLALNMILPFLLLMARDEPNVKLRRLLQIVFTFSVVAVIFTYSRGAFLGLFIVMSMLFLRARKRIVAIASIVILAGFVSMFAPQVWFERVETIDHYEQDQSANMRLNSWQVAWKLALDHPLTGGGFWVLPHKEIYDAYSPGTEVPNSAHSIYFAILGDHGFPGLLVFLSLVLSTLWSLRQIKRSVKNNPEGRWLVTYCEAVQASLVAYLVSGAFLQQAYFDLFYHLISFAILLRVIGVREGLIDVRVVHPAEFIASPVATPAM